MRALLLISLFLILSSCSTIEPIYLACYGESLYIYETDRTRSWPVTTRVKISDNNVQLPRKLNSESKIIERTNSILAWITAVGHPRGGPHYRRSNFRWDIVTGHLTEEWYRSLDSAKPRSRRTYQCKRVEKDSREYADFGFITPPPTWESSTRRYSALS